MERSRLLLVSLSGAFMLAGLGLMVVSADDKELYRDLTNAVQHIDEVRFTHTGSNPTDALMKMVSSKDVIGIKAKNFNITQKGENYNRIGANVSSSSILGGSKNKINGGSYNVIIAGSDNSIDCGVGVTVLGGDNNKARGSYTTILGGKDNTVYGCNSNNSVVVGSNNELTGQNSVVVGMNNKVVGGNQSVSMGENSKVNASNSFLWTDGNQNGVLEAGNVFAVAGDNGMVVNTDQAHSFAKLTIGGSLVLYGDNHGNFEGLGGGKIKVVNGDSNQKCFCSYDGDKWNSLFGKGRCNYYCNKELSSLEEPVCGTQVSKICGSVQYYYSGTCEKGKVVEGTGAYILDKENKVHWTCQTDDGKMVRCVGDVSVSGTCGETSKCRGTLPANAELNNPIAIADGGTYHFASTTDQSACAYHCKQNYDGSNCLPVVKENVDCTDLPANAKWVKGKFKQKWNGSFWYPIVKQATYKPASQGGASVECSYECIDYTHYYWDGTRCVAKSQLGNCTGKPANSLWVSGTFRQIWDVNSWKPESIPARHISDNSKDCYFKCDSAHVRNGTDCSCSASASFGQSCCKETTCTGGTFCSNSGKCEECTNYGGECRKSGGDLGVCVLVDGAGKCQDDGGVIPVNPDLSCNIEKASFGQACCSKNQGDQMDTFCERGDGQVEHNDNECRKHKVCEECDDYGKRCTRSYYEEEGYGQGICVKREGVPGTSQPFDAGECVACFGDNQTYDIEADKCAYVSCGTSYGVCNYCKIDSKTGTHDCESYNTSVSNGTWTCSRGDENLNGLSTVSCSISAPEPKGCNIKTAMWGQPCCSTSHGDSMDTECRPDLNDPAIEDLDINNPQHWTNNYINGHRISFYNDYECRSNNICEECTNYGGRCSKRYYERGNLGKGICVRRDPANVENGTYFGECVACFGDNETYDLDTGKCSHVECGDTEGACKYCANGSCVGYNVSASNGTWSCTKGDANINGVSTVSCGVPQLDPEPELYPNITYSWIDYCHMHPNGGCVDCNKWPTACQAAPQTQYISSTVWINLVVELGFFKDGDYISNDSTVIGKKGNTDIKLSDIDWSISVGDYSDKVNSNGSIKKYWMTIPDSVTVPWGATTTVRFKGSYDGTVLIDESLTEEFVKDAASCKVDSNGNISGKWFNASGKICSAGS